MTRTVDQMAEQLAQRFEDFDAPAGAGRDAAALRDLRRAFEAAVGAQAELADAVAVARAAGHSWAAIGAMVGTSGEAARQRYGT